MSHEVNDAVLERYYEDLQELGFYSKGASKLAKKAMNDGTEILNEEIPYLKDAKSIETMAWADTGCAVSTSCLQCPLPLCKHDDPEWYTAYAEIARHKPLIDELRGVNKHSITKRVESIAKKYQISSRTVFRLKKKVLLGNYNFDMIDLFYSKLYAKKGSKNAD